jgi:protein transport protein SEC61 subunit alpha
VKPCCDEALCCAALRRAVQGLLVFSRVGVYLRLPGVDVDRFAETMQGAGLLGYIDALSGGSISKVGIFSLGG